MNLKELLADDNQLEFADEYVYAYLSPEAYAEFKNEHATLSLFRPFWLEEKDISFNVDAPFDASQYVYGYYDSESSDAVFEAMSERHRTHAEFEDHSIEYLVFPYLTFAFRINSPHPSIHTAAVLEESPDGSAVIGIRVGELM